MMVKMYVSRPEILSNYQLDEISFLEYQISNTFGGFTKYSGAVGVWIDKEKTFHDVVDVYEVMVVRGLKDREGVIAEFTHYAIEFANLMGQKCIPFTIIESENIFVEGNK